MFCRMCNIDSKLTKHHLIPRCKDKNRIGTTVDLCCNCHTFLHAVFSENYLKEHLNTLEKIMQHQQCQMTLKIGLFMLSLNVVAMPLLISNMGKDPVFGNPYLVLMM